MGEPVGVGLVGCGKISGQYLTAFDRLAGVRVTACTDLDPARAAAVAAARPGVTAVSTVDELVARSDVDIVLNLTLPAGHAEVALAAIAAGKHVYNEKPLAAGTVEAAGVLRAAAAAGVRVGCAPDTVLGTGTQTARAALRAGRIGTPVAATAFMMSPGHESWHPDPEFYYRPGGGPLLDMGPYYLTALVTMLGPVVRVTGAASRGRTSRTIGSGPRAGTVFDTEVDTHVAGILEHAGGALSTVVFSFEVAAARLPRIEVYGTAGTLAVPDPNAFDGVVEVGTGDGWTALPAAAGIPGAGRGVGVADLAAALAGGRPHRASAELAYHVLDVMESLAGSAATGTPATLTSTCPIPDPVPLDGTAGTPAGEPV
jgi:predicted dehydrogenase